MAGLNPIALFPVGGAILILILSIPMMLGRVGPNSVYGFRTAKTRSDPRIWYAVNKVAGRNLAIASLMILLTAIGLFLYGRLGVLETVLVDLGVQVLALSVAIGQAAVVLRRS